MTIEIGVGRKKIDNVTDPQTFSVAGMSETPKLALFRMVAADSNATSHANACWMRGATDGSTDLVVNAYSEDGEISTDGKNAGQVGAPGPSDGVDGQCVRLHRPSDGQYQSFGFKAHFDSWLAGGVRLDIVRFATEGDWYLEYVLIGGAEFSAEVSSVDFSGAPGSQSVTSFGQPADVVLLWGIDAAIPTVNSTGHFFSEGWWSRSAHSTPGGCAVVTAWGNAENPAECAQVVLEGYVSAFLGTDSPGGDLDGRMHVEEHASGFTVVRDEDVPSSLDWGVVQMNFGGTKVAWVGIEDSPLATGAQNVRSPKIVPDLVLGQFTRKDSVNVDDANESDASVLSGGSAVPGTTGFCMVNTQEHGQGNPTVTTSFADDRFVRVPLPSGSFGTGALTATMGAALADGFALSWTQVDTGQARKMVFLAIGASQTIAPDPVEMPLALGVPTLTITLVPAPVEIPLVLPDAAVLGPTEQTPDPVLLELSLPTPFTGFLLPDPVAIPLVLPEPEVDAPGPPPPPPPDLAETYRRSLFDLLPLGYAWNRRPESVLGQLLFALAREFATLEERGLDVRDEADPRTASELLSDWEEWLGIALDCGGIEDSVQERRAAIFAKLTNPGGQNRFHYSELAKALGFEVEVEDIVEFQEFRAGESAAGEALTNGTWVFAWEVHAPEETPRFFRTGTSAVGEPLVTFGNELLECVVELVKPAHTLVLFVFDLTWTGYSPWETLAPAPVVVELEIQNVLVSES